jgi:hypothetical protein
MEKTKKEKELESKVEELTRQLEDIKKDRAKASTSPRDTKEAYLNEYVDIRLFKDNGKYKDPLYVGINGQNCMIPRGEFVRVKRKFALLIEQSELQETRAAEAIQSAKDRYAQESLRPTMM